MISIALFFFALFGCFVAALVYLPVFAFLGYQVIYLMYHPTRWWYYSVPDVPYSFAFSMLILGLALFAGERRASTPIFSLAPFRYMYALVAWHALVFFWATSQTQHAEAIDDFVKLALVMAAAFKLCSSKKCLDYMMYTYVAGAAYLGYYTWQFGRSSYGRVDNVFTVDSPDVNGVAALLVPPAILALYYFWIANSWKQRAVMIVFGAFIVNALVLMNSRGAFLGLFVGGAYFMYRLLTMNSRAKVSRGKVMAVAFAGLLALVVVFDESAVQRVLSVADETELREDQQTGSTRVFYWIAAFEMSKDHPFGLGDRSFIYNSPRYIPESVATGRSRNRAVHSTWFQTLTDVGYPGLILFLLMLYSTYRLLVRVRKYCMAHDDQTGVILTVALEASCVSYMIAMSFLDRMRAEVLFWLVLFAACAFSVYVAQSSVSEKSVSTRRGMLPPEKDRPVP